VKLFLAFILLLLASCKKEVSCTDNFDKKYNLHGESEKLVILSNGIWASESYWNTNSLKSDLVNHGYQVVTYTYPYTDVSFFNDKGKCYRKNFTNYIEWLISDIEKKGIKKEVIAMGFSFGGLHSIIAASNNDRIKNYVGILPSIDIGVIFKSANTRYFNARYETNSLKNKHGLIISGLKDNIVDHRISYKWSKKMVDSVDHIYFDIDHRMNDEMIKEVITWVDKI